ncbi:kinase-like domain-containing protein [Chytriomyces sp. MP71]|nr:kinase-like domain-containing protein [Chytriomyces sp. MP71]
MIVPNAPIRSLLTSPTNSASDSEAQATAKHSAATSATQQHSRLSRKQLLLYHGFTSEEKAKSAILHFVRSCPNASKFKPLSVLGFGSNGVVLSVLDQSSQELALKIIYKAREGHDSEPTLAEVENLKQISSQDSSNIILKHVLDFQDSCHWYLVTEKFGYNWLGLEPSLVLEPLRFSNSQGKEFELPFSAGCCDLWGWSYIHRSHSYRTNGTTILPLEPIKAIIRQAAKSLMILHRHGFYHGDIKLENILVESTREGGIKLADYGRSKHASFGIRSYGTLDVSAPELLFDAPYLVEDLDGRACDVFALGMVMFSLLGERGELPEVVRLIKAKKIGYEFLVRNFGSRFPINDIVDLEEGGLDLLESMLRIDSSHRLTIEETLAHPFLTSP